MCLFIEKKRKYLDGFRIVVAVCAVDLKVKQRCEATDTQTRVYTHVHVMIPTHTLNIIEHNIDYGGV